MLLVPVFLIPIQLVHSLEKSLKHDAVFCTERLQALLLIAINCDLKSLKHGRCARNQRRTSDRQGLSVASITTREKKCQSEVDPIIATAIG